MRDFKGREPNHCDRFDNGEPSDVNPYETLRLISCSAGGGRSAGVEGERDYKLLAYYTGIQARVPSIAAQCRYCLPKVNSGRLVRFGRGRGNESANEITTIERT